MPLVETPLPPDLPTLTAPTPRLPFDPAADPEEELDRQVRAHVALGTATSTGLDDDGLRRLASALLPAAEAAAADDPWVGVPEDDRLPFLLVLDVDANDAAPAMRRGDRRGLSVVGREEMAGYRPLPGVDVPGGRAYLVTGVDVGSGYCGVRPEDAVADLATRARTPLTIGEGVSLVVVRPDLLRPNRCFSLAGSRAANQRVPAVWISDRRAKLGWCWDRNPHTWLGVASATGRTGAPAP